MGLKSIFKKAFNKRRGVISKINVYELKSQIIAEPITGDIDGDGKAEVVVATKNGSIMVFNEDGSKKWEFRISEEVDSVEEMFLEEGAETSINSSPRIYDDGKTRMVLFGTELGVVYALNEKGKQVWSYKTDDAIRGSVNVFDADNNGEKEIVFGSADKNIYILDKKGKLIRKISGDSPIESTPALYKGLIVAGNNSGEIIAYTPEGKKAWVFKTEGKITAEPTLLKTKRGEEYLLVGSTDDTLYCLAPKGVLAWKYETEGAIYSKAVVHDIDGDGNQEIIFGSCDNKVYVLDVQGKKLWNFETDFWVVGTPVVMDIDNDGKEEVIIGSYDTNIYVLSGEGAYNVDYIPGTAGIAAQEGSYSDITNQNPGEIVGKKLWLVSAADMIIGCSPIGNKIIVETKRGFLIWIMHKDG